MSGLLGPDGRPISSATFGQFKKATPPTTKEIGAWAGRDLSYLELPGGGTIGFDLNQLTLSDYRKMTNHYQIHASLSVLSFMQHQSEWTIECEDARIAKHCTENLEKIWTQLTRAMATANWAGFAPNVLQWENDSQGRTTQLAKIKDLVPEESMVHWNEVEGWAPPGSQLKPKYKVYGGIKQIGNAYPIPVEATYWYPLLMENGDYYGKKLLKPAFTSWYFSLLLHLFANRYYERFGEPTPIGRAPMDEEVSLSENESINSRDYLMKMLQNIRSRSAVVLPNDRNPMDMNRTSGTPSYDYEIEYLESQMRGADFERYMTRLDEEMSIGLFTPILLLRTADVGSYNLGVGHMQMYLWMLNALNGDRKFYIDKYILPRMVDYNFSPNAPRAYIKFRKLGNSNNEMIASILQALISSGKAKPNLDQLGELAGLKLTEVRELTTPAPEPDDADDPSDDGGASSDDTPTDIAARMKDRVASQLGKAFSAGSYGPGLQLDVGYRKKMARQLHLMGKDSSQVGRFYAAVESLGGELLSVPFETPAEYMTVFSNIVDRQLEEVLRA